MTSHDQSSILLVVFFLQQVSEYFGVGIRRPTLSNSGGPFKKPLKPAVRINCHSSSGKHRGTEGPSFGTGMPAFSEELTEVPKFARFHLFDCFQTDHETAKATLSQSQNHQVSVMLRSTETLPQQTSAVIGRLRCVST